MKLTAYSTELRLRREAARLHALCAETRWELMKLTVGAGFSIDLLPGLVSEAAEAHFSARDLEIVCDSMLEEHEERVR